MKKVTEKNAKAIAHQQDNGITDQNGHAKRRTMELAIAIAGALALVFGVALTVAQYYQKHSLVVWFTYLTVVAGLLLPALYWQKRIWDTQETATEHRFAAAYHVVILPPHNRSLDAGHYLLHQIGGEEIVSPIHVLFFIRFTNQTTFPIMIDNYAVEMKAGSSGWVRLPRIDVRNGSTYAPTNNSLKEAMSITFAPSGFDTVIHERKIAPKETVRGWVFAEMPAGDYSGKVLSWRLYVKDFSGSETTEALQDFRSIDSVQGGAQIHTFIVLKDLSKHRVIYYSDAKQNQN